MRLRILLSASLLALLLLTTLHGQKPFKQYPGMEYENFPLPSDWEERTEFTFGRLMYPGIPRREYRPGNTRSWTIDYPRSDRHLLAGLRRLTRIHARSVEQVIDLDDEGEIFNWPWTYAVEVGHWNLTEAQCKMMREFFLKGGFLMVDDFHGTQEWGVFLRSLNRIFPDRAVVDIPDADPIFHTLYDLDDRYQVPGAQFLYSQRVYEKDGFEARWRGVYDDKGRIMVAICHNMDLGDSWENSDDPAYPEKYSALGYRIGVDYVIYSMTH